ALLPGSSDVLSTVFDPVPIDGQLYDAGVEWLSNAAGTRSRAFRVYNGTGGPGGVFGKANGLGDLEILCDAPPIEIGPRVWNDLLDSDAVAAGGAAVAQATLGRAGQNLEDVDFGFRGNLPSPRLVGLSRAERWSFTALACLAVLLGAMALMPRLRRRSARRG